MQHKLHLRNTEWIPVFGYCDPNTENVARLEKSVKKTRAARFFFFAFRKSSNISSNLDRSVQTRESIWYFFYKIITDEKQLT